MPFTTGFQFEGLLISLSIRWGMEGQIVVHSVISSYWFQLYLPKLESPKPWHVKQQFPNNSHSDGFSYTWTKSQADHGEF